MFSISFYQQHLGISKSLPLAVKCLEKLNEDMDIVADSIVDLETFIMNTTHILYKDDDVYKDFEHIINGIDNDLLRDSDYPHVKMATPHLINLLGTVYLEMKDYKNAIKNFERAISFDSLGALMNLSNMYRDGLGIDQDKKIAFMLKKKVADLVISGYASDWLDLSVVEERTLMETLYEVAESYHYGIGTNQSFDEAVKYYSCITDTLGILIFLPQEFIKEIVAKANDAICEIAKLKPDVK